jgi:hypothetical protein
VTTDGCSSKALFPLFCSRIRFFVSEKMNDSLSLKQDRWDGRRRRKNNEQRFQLFIGFLLKDLSNTARGKFHSLKGREQGDQKCFLENFQNRQNFAQS